MASGLSDRRTGVLIMALECLKIHDLKCEKRREAKQNLFEPGDLPPGWTPPRPLPPWVALSLTPPLDPPKHHAE
jgi:hypothetical protein